MEDFQWNVTSEGRLLESMVGHKPVGVNKFFQMAFIVDKFNEKMQGDIDSVLIRARLQSMYNLDALDEGESMPFPNDEKEFYLPDLEYATLKLKKEEKPEDKKIQKGRETPKNLKEKKETPSRNSKERRDSRDSKESKTPQPVKKETKKEAEKAKVVKGRNSISSSRDDKNVKNKHEDTPRPPKRPTRGSLKPEEVNSSGKASPINVTPGVKRRRI